MKKYLRTTFFSGAICCAFLACEPPGDEPETPPKASGTTPTLLITPIEQLNRASPVVNSHAGVTSRSSLKMNYRTYVEPGKSALGVDAPHYPRIKRTANGNYIAFFHNNQIGAACYYAVSENLRSWSAKGKLFSNYAIIDSDGVNNERRYSTCDALLLANGDLLAVASYRPNNGYREKPFDNGLALRRSTNHGLSWSEPIDIYRGVNWEPFLLQLPSGEIHCYFTDSNRTGVEPTDTGTAMIVSTDNGRTWTPAFGNAPRYVIRTKHQKGGKTYFNDQMPAVICLNDSHELAAAVEANIDGYHISFAYTGDDGLWDDLTVTQEGPADRNDGAFSGSAPYLVQFPSGETALSYNRSSTFYLKMGDARASHFGEAMSPFSGKGFWGSLERIDAHRLIGAMPNTGAGTVMLAQFVLNHRLTATRRTVIPDGDNVEWLNTDEALFVGSRSQAQATLRCSADDRNVYFLIESLDKYLSADDYIDIYLSPAGDQGSLTAESCRIRLSHEGLKRTDTYAGSWVGSELGVVSGIAFDDRNTNDNVRGYVAELAIPRSKLNMTSGELLINFALYKKTSGEDAIIPTSRTSTAEWIPINGL
jgi:hypothetical protein